jgi:hypothetical protein
MFFFFFLLLCCAFSVQAFLCRPSLHSSQTIRLSNSPDSTAPDSLHMQDEVEVDFDALSAESASQAFQTKTDISSMYVKGERKAPRQAKWFPMLLSPTALDGSLAGDVGFDPLGFSQNKVSLYRFREAEIKHSRLAMLAAAGWPLSELWHKEIANVLGLDSILADAGRAPSVLNGGLSNAWILGAAVFSLAIGGLLESRSFSMVSKIIIFAFFTLNHCLWMMIRPRRKDMFQEILPSTH